MNKKLIYIVILILLSILSCNTIDQSTKDSAIKEKPQEAATKIAKIKEKPCWAKKALEKCPLDTNEYHHLFAKLNTSISASKDNEKEMITKELSIQYEQYLKNDLKNQVLSNDKCISSTDVMKKCKIMFDENIDSVLRSFDLLDKINFLDLYVENVTESDMIIFGLGGVIKSIHENLVKIIMINEFQSKLDALYREAMLSELDQIEYPQTVIEPMGQNQKEETKEYDTNGEQSNRNSDTEISESQNCFHSSDTCNIDFNWTDFGPHLRTVESTNKLETIQKNRLNIVIDKIMDMYKLKYDEARRYPIILEPLTVCQKQNPKKIDIDHKQYKQIAKDQKITFEKLCRCIDKKANNMNIKYFNKKMSLLEKVHQQGSQISIYDNYEFEWRNLMTNIFQKKKEIKELEKMYRQRLNLLTHTYIIFSFFNKPADASYNAKLMKDEKKSNALAKLALKNEAVHYIMYQLKKNDNFVKQVMENNYQFGIKPSASDGIELNAITEVKGYIQKYELIEESHNRINNLEKINNLPPENKYSGSKVISGCLDLRIIELKDGYQCENFFEIRDNIFNNIAIRANEKGIERDLLKNERDKIVKFIEDVIRKNASMKKDYLEIKKDYLTKREEKEDIISVLIAKIVHNNKELKKAFENITDDILLPENLLKVSEIQFVINQRSEKLRDLLVQKKTETAKKWNELRKQEPRVLITIINQEEEWTESNVREVTKHKLDSLVMNSCSSFNTGNGISIGDEVSGQNHISYLTQPIVQSFDIPVFRRSLKDTNTTSIEFSFPIVLNVICRGIPEQFEYDERTQEIIDHINNIRWEAGDFAFTPRRRKDVHSDFESLNMNDINQAMKFFDDYNDFCVDYTKFLEKMYEDATTDYPKMKCLKRFEYNSVNNTIIDNLRREKWTIIPQKLNYANLNSYIRETEMRTSSIEGIQRLFKELSDVIYKDKSLSIIIDVLKDKYYWTNTKYNRRKIIVLLNFQDNALNEKDVKTSSMAYGLVVSKLIY